MPVHCETRRRQMQGPMVPCTTPSTIGRHLRHLLAADLRRAIPELCRPVLQLAEMTGSLDATRLTTSNHRNRYLDGDRGQTWVLAKPVPQPPSNSTRGGMVTRDGVTCRANNKFCLTWSLQHVLFPLRYSPPSGLTRSSCWFWLCLRLLWQGGGRPDFAYGAHLSPTTRIANPSNRLIDIENT